MNKKTKFITSSIVAGSLLLGGAALARPGGGHHRGGPGGVGHMFGRLLHKLDLSEAQEDLVVEAKANMKRRHKASRTGRRAAFETVAAELSKKQPDQARLHALIDQQIEEMKKNMHAGLDDMLKVHASLTDEQRTELVRQVERKRKHRRMMKGEE